MATPVYADLDAVQYVELPEPLLGCEECLKTGDRWVHLRMCSLSCGNPGVISGQSVRLLVRIVTSSSPSASCSRPVDWRTGQPPSTRSNGALVLRRLDDQPMTREVEADLEARRQQSRVVSPCTSR